MLHQLLISETQYLYEITVVGDRAAMNAFYEWMVAKEIRTWHANETYDLAGTPKPIKLEPIKPDGLTSASTVSLYHRSFQVREADMILIKLRWTPSR